MEMRVVWRSLRRRWYLVLALAVLTLGATFLVAQRVGETYEATGTVLVFPPSQTEGPTGEMSEDLPEKRFRTLADTFGLTAISPARTWRIAARTRWPPSCFMI